jgi:hypothetical protein
MELNDCQGGGRYILHRVQVCKLDCLVLISRETRKQEKTPDHLLACTKILLNWPGKGFNLACANRWKVYLLATRFQSCWYLTTFMSLLMTERSLQVIDS